MKTKKVSTFQERFAQLLSESDVGDTAVAAAIGVSYKSVYAWKTGSRMPKPPTIQSIANYFEVSQDWLNGLDVPREEEKPERSQAHTIEARLISHGVDAMPPEQRERALKMFKLLFEQYADRFEEENDDDETGS